MAAKKRFRMVTLRLDGPYLYFINGEEVDWKTFMKELRRK